MKDQYLIQLIDKLTSIYLMQGVQPSELADAIFDEPYTDMSLIKKVNVIEVILSFKETCDSTGREHFRMIKYVYNLDKFLMQTFESIDSKGFKITWDREQATNTILDDIKNRLREIGCSSTEMKKILSTLPTSPKLIKNTKLYLVS